jgi:hypothetical protein
MPTLLHTIYGSHKKQHLQQLLLREHTHNAVNKQQYAEYI